MCGKIENQFPFPSVVLPRWGSVGGKDSNPFNTGSRHHWPPQPLVLLTPTAGGFSKESLALLALYQPSFSIFIPWLPYVITQLVYKISVIFDSISFKILENLLLFPFLFSWLHCAA